MTGIEAIGEQLARVRYEGVDLQHGAVDAMTIPALEGAPAGTEQVRY